MSLNSELIKMDKLENSRLQSFLDNPSKGLWTLAIPIMAGMGIQTLYTVVDMIFIGRLGGNAIAAVAFNMPLLFLVMGLTFGIGSGVTASIARFIGAKDKVNADNSAEHALAFAVLISLVLMGMGVLFGSSMLKLMGAVDPVLSMSWGYLKVIIIGLPFMISSTFFRSILSGEGDMKLPMMIAGLGTIVNIILDPLFIFTFQYGVVGAAIATIISQAIVFFIFVYMLFIKEHAFVRFRLKDFNLSKFIILDIIKVGLPASMSMIIMAFGQLVFNRILISYSTNAVAAYQIGGRIDMVVFLPIMSIAASLTTLVGMFFGAKEEQKLRFIVKYGLIRSILITIFLSGLLYIFAPNLVKGFSTDPDILALATMYLRYITLIYPLISIGMTVGRILQGLGQGLPMLIITSIRILLVSAPLAIYFKVVLDKPIQWVWYAMMISTVAAVSISLVWVKNALGNLKFSKVA